jgi:glutathione synthase
MDYAFILDPLPELKAYKDSSVAMMRSLARRGHAIYALQQSDIYWTGSARTSAKHAGARRSARTSR